MATFRIDPSRHFIRETPAAHFLRRHLNDPDLFTMFNATTGMWTIGYWVHRGNGVAYDVEDIGPTPVLTPELVQFMERTRTGTTLKQIKDKVYRAFCREQDSQRDELSESVDAYKWAKKKVGDRAPIPYGYSARVRPCPQPTARVVGV